MTTRISGLLTTAAILLAAASARADDQKDIEGHWKIEKALRGGNEMPAEERDKTTLEFKGGKVTIHADKQEKPAEFTLDPKTTPKNIVIKPEGQDKELQGIYQLKGDSLTICFSREGADRPKEFESKEGSKHMLIVLKRVKK
jgi:uncharacterized protein (TIGR03067 family)